MPIYDNLLEIQGLAAKNDWMRSQVDENKAKAALYGQQAELLQEDAQTQRATRAAMQAVQLAQDQTDPNVTPSDVPAVSDPIQKAIAADMATIKTQKTLAENIRRTGGDIKAAEKADTLAASAQQTLFHNLNLAMQAQKDRAKQVASAAGALLPDQSNVREVAARLDAVSPGWMKGADVDLDIYGQLAPGKRTVKYLATVQQQGVDAEKQLELRQKQLNYQQEEDKLRQRKVEEDGRNARADRTARLSRDGLDIREAELQDRKDARAGKAIKGGAPKTPIKSDVDSTAVLFEQDPEMNLPPDQAEAAAWDYHKRVNDAVAKGVDRTEAEQEARDAIVSRIKPGEEGKWSWTGYTKATKASYDKWKQTAKDDGVTPAAAIAAQSQGLSAVGVGYKQVGDKITLTTTARTPPAKAGLIAKAQQALDSGKYDPVKVMEILKQQMVAP